MRKNLIMLLCLMMMCSFCIMPAYAATSVNGISFPITLAGGQTFSGINSASIDLVDAFVISVNYDGNSSYFYINLYTSSGACSYGTYSVGDSVRLTYDSVSNALSRQGLSVNDLTYVDVYINTTESYSVTYDVAEKSGILTGIIRWFSDAFDRLLKPITDFITQIQEQQAQKDSIWESIGQSFTKLLDALSEATIVPVKEFFDSLSLGAILIWQEFLALPIIREFTYAVVLVSIFGGLLILLMTF